MNNKRCTVFILCVASKNFDMDESFLINTNYWVALLPSATKLRRLCFYTCLSVHGGGGSASVHAGYPPGAETPQQTATAADGTHLTGMHSCDFLMVY